MDPELVGGANSGAAPPLCFCRQHHMRTGEEKRDLVEQRLHVCSPHLTVLQLTRTDFYGSDLRASLNVIEPLSLIKILNTTVRKMQDDARYLKR